MKFDLPKDQSSIIKVIGVGGGGSNAVNYMYSQGIKGVDFIVCNTDQQALDISPVPTKIQLGATLTEGRGAGSIPDMGRNAAIENLDEIKTILSKNTKMVFITAGMGGGTGTGAAPVIAATAKELGILTVGIVTIPFAFEGKKRKQQAEQGIEEMRRSVDTLIIVCNDRLREMYGNLSLTQAFSHADDVLTTAAKGIAEIITVTGSINVDFEDVRTVMTNSGVALMGSATSEGENRAIKAIEAALNSPLLNDNNIEGAHYVLLNITYGNQEIHMDEVVEITDYIQETSGNTAEVIWGHGKDESLGDKINVTIIATGFKTNPDFGYNFDRKPEKKFLKLEEDTKQPSTTNPVFQTTKNHFILTEDEQTVSVKQTEKTEDEPFIKNEEISGSTTTTKEINFIQKQRVIEFDLSDNEPTITDKNPMEPFYKKQEPQAITEKNTQKSTSTEKQTLSSEEQQQIIKDRINRLKELSLKLKAPSGLSELENEPAYRRRKIELDDTPTSNESKISKYTLSEEVDPITGEKKYNIRDNNSFLHDNVD